MEVAIKSGQFTASEVESICHRKVEFIEGGMNFYEIAQVLGITPQRVQQIYSRAMRKLRNTANREILQLVSERGQQTYPNWNVEGSGGSRSGAGRRTQGRVS